MSSVVKQNCNRYTGLFRALFFISVRQLLTNQMHILKLIQTLNDFSNMFRYMCTTFRENAMPVLKNQVQDGAHVPKHVGEAHLLCVLI